MNEYDLRPYNESDHSQFIMQGIHTTLVHHYNDTLNFLVISADNITSTVHVSSQNYQAARMLLISIIQAFSISEIATANCDMGQNYKNLVGYVKGLGKPFSVVT